ncbi:MAG: twin-arginine translocase subunit TatC [Candidatus Dormibacteraeota bacterium]|nr:twin-arginine translocase subunit TatC [Candidatus Dormibacteraeota bacterium]
MAAHPYSAPITPGRHLGGGPAQEESPALTLVEHLEDLRRVVIICLIAWVAATSLAFAFNHELIQILERPLLLALRHRGSSPFGNSIIVTSPLEGLSIPFKVAAAAGIVISLPIVAWQAWTFVAPGLLRQERRLFAPFIAATLFCFAMGATFAYFIMPVGLSFLSTFLGSDAVYLPDLGSYLSFFALVIVVFGVAFEMPVVLCLLAAVRIIDSQKLRRWRKISYFVIVGVSLVITPGADPFTPTFLSVALVVLYEASVLVIRHGLRR